jgi:hypothetical protein
LKDWNWRKENLLIVILSLRREGSAVDLIVRLGRFVSLAAISYAALSLTVSDQAPARPRRSELSMATEEQAPPKGPLFFVISLNKQQVSVYSPDGLYAKSPVSTGQPGHPTPQGIFTILNKELYHESNIYSGAPMPFMQRITYTGVAMHEGVLPGYPASHGCIRMPHDFAERMYRITAGNERVVITHQDAVPVEISHPRLPSPKFVTAGSGSSGMLNPLDYAKLMKVRAVREAEDAEAAIEPARRAAYLKAGEVRLADVAHRKAEIAVAAAKDKVEAAARSLQRVTAEEAIKAEMAAKAAAEERLKEAQAALEAAARVKTQKEQEAEAATRAAKEAVAKQQFAAGAIKSWDRRLAPLSIFISRKTQRLYVRQDYRQVFDLPITILDPDRPLGTHLFIAMPKEAGGGAPEKALQWLALTVPEAVHEADAEDRAYGGVNNASLLGSASPTARQALDRIEIPDAVAEKLSEMVWGGAAIIVSDNAMSHETTDFARTDFVVITGKETSRTRPLSARGERFAPM